MTETTPQTPQWVTDVDDLVQAFCGVPGILDEDAAYLMWEHPRFGPLLRGEGAPALDPAGLYRQGRRDAWAAVEAIMAAACAEVARQQGGQAGGQAPLEGLVPVCYDAGGGTRIERTRVTPCPLWAVRCGVRRMSINREWTFEPMPSGCTPEYLAMHSFPSPAAAWAELQLYRETAFSDITPGEGGQADG